MFHGANVGHGYVKYVAIDEAGQELPPVVFPARIAPAGEFVVGSIRRVETVQLDGRWWVGEDADLAPTIITKLSQERLVDPVFVPVLLASALQRLGAANAEGSGPCVTGLPASWAQEREKAAALSQLLRRGYPGYSSIKIIPEPIGLIYAEVLDGHGEIVGDPALMSGRVATVDLGHLTVDTAVLKSLVPEPTGLNTFNLGTSRPLAQIRSRLSQHFDVDLDVHQVDQAVRVGHIRLGGQDLPLPSGWDAPILDNARTIVARLRDLWNSGRAFEAILLGGGGAAEPRIAEALAGAFPNARLVKDPQMAIARGYARLARRVGK